MEFKSLKNIETSFRQIRLFTLVVVCLCVLLAGYSVWSAYSFAEAQRQKIYVLDGGKSLMLALSQDLSQNRPAEAKEHVRRFHELFFTLSPDKSAIEGNISRALLLADKSAYNYYRDFSEKGYYNRIVAGNINQVVQVDSVLCDFDRYPYAVRTHARGHYGLERYDMIEAHNLGSQVPNEEFIAKAIELKADALLVSQTVTQKDVHIKNMIELVEMLEAEGLRDKVILACGGPRISHELAKELGYDAGFGMNTYADDVASFVAQEFVRRKNK